MDLLVSDRSVHGQFRDLAGFRSALSRLMALRETAGRFGHEVQCHRAFLNAEPIPGVPLQSAVGSLETERRRAVMTWLTRSGPFWDDVRRHGKDDWLECNGEVVTDSAIGEAAFRILHGVKCGLVSLEPSNWCDTPLDVIWVRKAEGLDNCNAVVENLWSVEKLEESLRDRVPLLRSWDGLRKASESRFANLVFSKNCFRPLAGIPFAKSSADRFTVLLDVLNHFARAFDDDGKRNARGHHIYQKYFTGGQQALFSDSSDKEKRKFRGKMTFVHPENSASSLFCPWHGKVRHQTLRLHFSWPVEAGKPVYVVYAGPKITKQ